MAARFMKFAHSFRLECDSFSMLSRLPKCIRSPDTDAGVEAGFTSVLPNPRVGLKKSLGQFGEIELCPEVVWSHFFT